MVTDHGLGRDPPGRPLGPGRRPAAYPDRVSRRAPGWVPNQHGAWAMLATPLLVGILSSHPRWVHLPLTAFWFVGSFAFFATGLWLKAPPRRRLALRRPLVTYAAGAGALGLLVLALSPGLGRWAPAFVLPMAIGLWSSWKRDERSLLSGVATTAGSCLMTLVAHDAGGGTDRTRAWVLAGVLAAYFVGTVLYVKTMIRERDQPVFHWLSMGFHSAATLAMVAVSGWLVVVFAALAVRASVVPAFRFSPKAVGIGEIVATVTVALTALAVTA